MKRTKCYRSIAAGATVLAGLCDPSIAEAQTPRGGWALNRYDPTPAGDNFFYSEHPWYSNIRRFAVGLETDFSTNPLVLERSFTDGRTERSSLVSSMLMARLGGEVSLLNRIGLGLSLPVSLFQDGTVVNNGTSTLGPSAGLGVGDLRANVRVRIFGHADTDPISLHVGGSVWLPIGSREDNTGDGGPRAEPRVILAGRVSAIRWSFSTGVMLRSDLGFSNLAVGNELRVSAAVGLVALRGRLTVGPEAYVVSSVSSLPSTSNSAIFQDAQWGAELLAGGHYLLADKILLGVGAGPGIQRGYGIPAFRALLTVAYAPVTAPRVVLPPMDTDRDGDFDPEDLCPTVPKGENPDPSRRGCPLPDTDTDGVMDPDDQCVTAPQGEHPDPNRRGCPLGDRDGDTVLDPDDQCIDLAQGEHPDPERRGCPDGDRDSDTVLDHQDLCVDIPRGPYPDPARAGCPLADRDQDTVPDTTDHCPDQPGAPSTNPILNGCPGEVRMEAGRITLLLPVFFDVDRDSIRPQSFRVLERVADLLTAAAYIRRVSIDGHTDDRGTLAHNMDLSQRRVNSVQRWLSAHGLAEGRLEAHGYGPTRPLVPNTNAASRARNRRVEFLVLDPAPPAGTGTQVQMNTPPAAPRSPAAPVTPSALPAANRPHLGRHRTR